MRLLRSLTLLAALSAGIMNAAVVFIPAAGGSLTASVVTDFTTFAQYDVRGAGIGLVGLTPTEIADSELGTDPDLAVLPFGNTSLAAFTLDLQSIVALTFDFSAPQINATTATLDVTGIFLTNADNSLAPLVGPLKANFAFESQTAFGNAFLLRYSLTDISDLGLSTVPEPSTWALVGMVLPVAAYGRRRRTCKSSIRF